MMFSLILPVYNVEKYLEKCLDTIKNQTYNDFEVILVDDGSKDNSLQICKKYAESDSRFIVIHKDNEGVSATRNTGLEYAKGDWIIFIDPDDWISEDCLQECNKIIANNDIDALCYNAVKVYEIKGESQVALKNIAPDGAIVTQEDKKELLFALAVSSYYNKFYFGEMIRAVWGKALKRTIIEDKHIRFDNKLSHGEDCIFLMEYFSTCDKVLLMNKYLYYYRIREGSAVYSGPSNMEELYRYQFLKVRQNLQKYKKEKECSSVLSACKLGCAKNCISGLIKRNVTFIEQKKMLKQLFESEEFSEGKYYRDNYLRLHRREALGCKLLDNKCYTLLLLLYYRKSKK